MRKLLLTCLFLGTVYGEKPQPCPGEVVDKPMDIYAKIQAVRLGVRQTEGRGIGYKCGYTTAQAVVSPNYSFERFFYFVDLRAHRFDNAKYGANAGAGMRWFTPGCCTIWGFNGFYDYRQTSRVHYTQIGAGLEALTGRFAYRLNAYIPICRRMSDIFDVKPDGTFKREFAMRGGDAEFAGYFFPTRNIELMGAVGPYYYHGEFGQHAFGARARFAIRLLDYIVLQVSGSYDNLFNWIGQGQIGFSVPLGFRMKDRGIARSDCAAGVGLERHLVRPVDRAEITVVHRATRDFDETDRSGL